MKQRLTKETLQRIINEEVAKLLERPIGRFSHNIRIDISVDKSNHAGERQFRHGSSAADVITDDEIVATAEAAIDEITERIILNKIDVGDEIVIRDREYELNLVCTLIPKKADILELRVITVMRKKNFIPKSGSKVVDI